MSNASEPDRPAKPEKKPEREADTPTERLTRTGRIRRIARRAEDERRKIAYKLEGGKSGPDDETQTMRRPDLPPKGGEAPKSGETAKKGKTSRRTKAQGDAAPDKPAK